MVKKQTSLLTSKTLQIKVSLANTGARSLLFWWKYPTPDFISIKFGSELICFPTLCDSIWELKENNIKQMRCCDMHLICDAEILFKFWNDIIFRSCVTQSDFFPCFIICPYESVNKNKLI